MEMILERPGAVERSGAQEVVEVHARARAPAQAGKQSPPTY
jgi:hypothetical protein